MSKPRSHHLDIYDCWLHLATTPKEWRRLQREYDLTDDIDCAGHAQLFVDTEHGNQPHVALWINPAAAKDQRALLDTIAHEATHTAAQLLDHIGQRTDRHDSEALAYLVGWVASWVYEAVMA